MQAGCFLTGEEFGRLVFCGYSVCIFRLVVGEGTVAAVPVDIIVIRAVATPIPLPAIA